MLKDGSTLNIKESVIEVGRPVTMQLMKKCYMIAIREGVGTSGQRPDLRTVNKYWDNPIALRAISSIGEV